MSFTLSDAPSAPTDQPLFSSISEQLNGRLSLIVSFASPPPSNGGSSLTDYQVLVDDGKGG